MVKFLRDFTLPSYFRSIERNIYFVSTATIFYRKDNSYTCYRNTRIPCFYNQLSHAIEITPAPRVENNALILIVGQPLSFFAPFFPPDAHFIGGIKLPISKYPRNYWSQATQRYPLTKLYYAYHFEKEVQKAITAHDGPIYILTVPWEKMTDPIFLGPLGLQKA